ncbi:hypothetical protein KIPB_003946 [Kipferlia bialata]|uniref:Uncharacterized protein n=1 Tax=Kipferlia bialata TaxID=797122 RepID=A0A9K3GH26_9EUKA|nr:hypothetical protein KIPB_003946 [Kipferlia bialata]|eukprot:g3946.t1
MYVGQGVEDTILDVGQTSLDIYRAAYLCAGAALCMFVPLTVCVYRGMMDTSEYYSESCHRRLGYLCFRTNADNRMVNSWFLVFLCCNTLSPILAYVLDQPRLVSVSAWYTIALVMTLPLLPDPIVNLVFIAESMPEMIPRKYRATHAAKVMHGLKTLHGYPRLPGLADDDPDMHTLTRYHESMTLAIHGLQMSGVASTSEGGLLIMFLGTLLVSLSLNPTIHHAIQRKFNDLIRIEASFSAYLKVKRELPKIKVPTIEDTPMDIALTLTGIARLHPILNDAHDCERLRRAVLNGTLYDTRLVNTCWRWKDKPVPLWVVSKHCKCLSAVNNPPVHSALQFIQRVPRQMAEPLIPEYDLSGVKHSCLRMHALLCLLRPLRVPGSPISVTACLALVVSVFFLDVDRPIASGKTFMASDHPLSLYHGRDPGRVHSLSIFLLLEQLICVPFPPDKSTEEGKAYAVATVTGLDIASKPRTRRDWAMCWARQQNEVHRQEYRLGLVAESARYHTLREAYSGIACAIQRTCNVVNAMLEFCDHSGLQTEGVERELNLVLGRLHHNRVHWEEMARKEKH